MNDLKTLSDFKNHNEVWHLTEITWFISFCDIHLKEEKRGSLEGMNKGAQERSGIANLKWQSNELGIWLRRLQYNERGNYPKATTGLEDF